MEPRTRTATSRKSAGGAGNKVPTPEYGRDRMLGDVSWSSNSFPKAYQKLYDSFVPMALSNGLPYRLEEVNNYFNGGATNASNRGLPRSGRNRVLV